MAVTSQELKDGKSVEGSKPLPAVPTTKPQRSMAIAVAGLIIGCILWPVGARYSIDGVFWLINMFLSFLRVPIALITPPHYAFYCLLAPVPYLCSRVEWHWPVYRVGEKWHIAPANVVVTWILIAGYDLGTTYLGVTAPSNSAAVMGEIAAVVVIAAVFAAGLTFGPEWLVRTAWKQLRA